MDMMGMAAMVCLISRVIWFLRYLGCSMVFLSNTSQYDREAKMKYRRMPNSLQRANSMVSKHPVRKSRFESVLTRRSSTATSSVAIYYRGAMRSGRRNLKGPKRTNGWLVCMSMMRRPALRWSRLRAGWDSRTGQDAPGVRWHIDSRQRRYLQPRGRHPWWAMDELGIQSREIE